MAFILFVILVCTIIGIVFGAFKNGKKGAAEYGMAGFGCGWMFLQLLQLISPILAVLFIIYLIVKGCST